MATAFSEIDDFVTCGICSNRFDESRREPKSLPCAHTVCLSCIAEIRRDGIISCPFCRASTRHSNSIKQLPNNVFALQMLKFTWASSLFSKLQSLCYTCESIALVECFTSRHCIVNLPAGSIKNLDDFLSLKKELEELKSNEKYLLNEAIEKAQEMQQHLGLLSTSISATKEHIHKLQEENNIQLRQLISKLESVTSSQTASNLQRFLNISSFMAEHDFNSPFWTMNTLKEKLGESNRMCQKTLDRARDMEFYQRMRIAVKVSDEDDRQLLSWPLLEDGFRLKNPSGLDGIANVVNPVVRQDLTMLSHVVSNLIRWKISQGEKGSQEMTRPFTSIIRSSTNSEGTSPNIVAVNSRVLQRQMGRGRSIVREAIQLGRVADGRGRAYVYRE